MCWVIWFSRNDIGVWIMFTQNLFTGTLHRDLLVPLSGHNCDKAMVNDVCRTLESVVIEIFAGFRWRFTNHIIAYFFALVVVLILHDGCESDFLYVIRRADPLLR